MADTRKPLQLKDIPVMNFGKYVLENMKQFGDVEALVSSFSFITLLNLLHTGKICFFHIDCRFFFTLNSQNLLPGIL